MSNYDSRVPKMKHAKNQSPDRDVIISWCRMRYVTLLVNRVIYSACLFMFIKKVLNFFSIGAVVGKRK